MARVGGGGEFVASCMYLLEPETIDVLRSSLNAFAEAQFRGQDCHSLMPLDPHFRHICGKAVPEAFYDQILAELQLQGMDGLCGTSTLALTTRRHLSSVCI